jgi:sortase A
MSVSELEHAHASDEAPAAGMTPVVDPRPRLRLTRRTLGITLLVSGLVLGGFLAYELALSAMVFDRSQQLLLQEFQDLADEGVASSLEWVPQQGDPIGLVSIPRLGIEAVAVEGTSPALTAQGPGHLRTSALPGRPGNSVIVGRRTSYGAPFNDLELLQQGDIITVSTGVGAFDYEVETVTTIQPGQPDVVGDSRRARLTLVTANPPYVPDGRLAVVASLVGDPAPGPPVVPVNVETSELAITGDRSAVAGVIVWTELLIATLAVCLLAARRWPRRLVWLYGAPTTLALAWASYVSLSQLLPSSY